jgi:hypothetical protein
MKNKFKKLLSKKIELEHNKINDIHKKYYNVPFDNLCCNENINNPKPMFKNIGEFEFKKVIDKLSIHYKKSKSNYYNDLIKIIRKYKISDNINNSKINEIYKDQIILDYIKCRPNTYIMTMWPKSIKLFKKFIDFIGKDGNIYYTKKINLNYNGFFNILYQLYSDIEKKDDNSKLRFIKSKMEYSGFKNNNKNQIIVIVFDNIKNKSISGQGSKYKEKIRKFLIDNLKDEDSRGSDLLHINDHFYQTIEYSYIYFNKNTLEYMQKKNLKNLLHYFFRSSFIKINVYKKWLLLNTDLLEQNNFSLFGGASFYTHGIRKLGDLDGLCINDKNISLEEKIYKDMFDKSTKIDFMDMGMPNSKAWSNKWNDINDIWVKNMEIKNLDDVVLDPSNYYYYNGLKILTLKNSIELKKIRYFASDYADFIMLNERFKNILNYKIDLDRSLIFRFKPYTMSKEKINKIIYKSVVKRYLKKDISNLNILQYGGLLNKSL